MKQITLFVLLCCSVVLHAQQREIMKLKVQSEQYNQLSADGKATVDAFTNKVCECTAKYAKETTALIAAIDASVEAKKTNAPKKKQDAKKEALIRTVGETKPYFDCLSSKDMDQEKKDALSAELLKIHSEYAEVEGASSLLKAQYVKYKMKETCKGEEAKKFAIISPFMFGMQNAIKKKQAAAKQ